MNYSFASLVVYLHIIYLVVYNNDLANQNEFTKVLLNGTHPIRMFVVVVDAVTSLLPQCEKP